MRHLSLKRLAPVMRRSLTDNSHASSGRGYDDFENPEQAIRYSRERVRLWFLGTAWSLGVAAISVASGKPADIYDEVVRRLPKPLRTPAYIVALAGADWALSLPLAYYSGYILEKRYHLSNQSNVGWLKDTGKALLLSVGLATPMVTGFYYAMDRWPHRWWLVTSACMLPLSVLFAGLAPVLILPIFNKYEPLKDAELERRLRAMAEGEGVHISSVMQMDMSRQTSKANAFFAGIGSTKRIALGDTLLENFEPDEIEVVVAHELGHQVHSDIWKLTAMMGVATIAGSYTLSRLLSTAHDATRSRTRAERLSDIRTLPMVSLITSTLSLAAIPFANALSRRMERAADRYAVELTKNPAGFVRAMRKLQRTNLEDPDPPAAVRILMYNHPTLGERIRWGQAQERV